MIINLSKVKSEALLLLCRDLIDNYKTNNDQIFNISLDIQVYIDKQIEQLYKAINVSIQPKDYYIRNQKVSRINFILKIYNNINNNISKQFKKGDKFNPAMLCFALLSTWFAEFSMAIDEKEYLYFTLYPYSEIYDKLLLNLDDTEYKQLNIFMINIAETTILKLKTYKVK